ncbi:unnamed protein product [Cuscuta epithymum]|uniref:hAT-like transposase RNase-H fold domain-containing protein n=1 Tax=Cuscuta epithymum TaxID=186058 RepID=A0AAV0EDV4_9ASTE|nr:unnamed protein product [Cuscuta epithymum]
MLHYVYVFKDVYPLYQRKEPSHTSCPSREGWEKVEKILDVLVIFSNLTNIISESEYLMSNLFLLGVCKIRQSLDNRGTAFVKDMVCQMKKMFDKYWGECNLLMSIVVVLDPRVKIRKRKFSSSQSSSTMNSLASDFDELHAYVKVETIRPNRTDLDM